MVSGNGLRYGPIEIDEHTKHIPAREPLARPFAT